MKKIASIVMTMVFALALYMIFAINVSAENGYGFETVDGEMVYAYSSDYDLTITIFGNPECSNTTSTIKRFIDSGISERDDICVIFVDCRGNTRSCIKDFADAYGDCNVYFCCDEDGLIELFYNWEYIYESDIEYGSSFLGNSLPTVVFVDGNGAVRKVTTDSLSAEKILSIVDNTEKAETDVRFTITGEDNYDNAYEVLSQLNELRISLGLDELIMDKELLEVAMQRAAETAIYYSHTRPDGTSCFTLTEDNYCHGENIAIGHRSPSDVMVGWINSSGHYANMISDNFKSVGIGCFETSDGVLCWVQYFSSSPGTKVAKSGSVVTSHTIEALYSNLLLKMKISGNPNLNYSCIGNEYGLEITNENFNFGFVNQKLDLLCFEFSSSDKEVINVDSNGVCSVTGVGEVVIKATLIGCESVLLEHQIKVKPVHTCPSFVYIIKPTCTEDGMKTRKCTECGYSETMSVDAIGHQPDGGKVIKKATYHSTGIKKYTCIVCGKTVSKVKIDKLTLGKVKNLEAVSVKRTSIKLSWSKVKGAKKYRIYQYIDGKWKLIKTTSKTSYTVDKLKSGTKYKFRVRAIIDSDVKGPYSSVLKTQTKLKTPSVALKAGTKKATVSWKKVTGADGYEIVYSTNSKMKNSKKVTVKKGSTTKKTIKKLKKGKKYYFKVRAYASVNGKKVYSSWSSVNNIKIK